MTEKTPAPVKRGDGGPAAHGIKGGPPIDQNSVTLHGFSPPAPAADGDETNPQAGEVTLKPQHAGGATMVPNDAPPVLAVRPPVIEHTQPRPIGPNDQTIQASPDKTMGGHDAGTQAFHKAAIAGAPKAVTPGQTFGHYELIEPIAKGGMGIVYKARQKKLNRIVAIKMILAGQFADQSDIDRFYAEAEAAAALSHPNIVAIHEIGEMNGQHFFSMDFIEGKSLSGLIQENPVPPRLAAEFTKTIAETMEFAHEKGVVHRDLKPANVLLDKRQRPLITDFGLAKQVSNTSQLTMAGSIVGTPSYMPPEQAAGKIDEIGPWSDLYSIGAILYELLTGRPPFRASNPFETVRQVIEVEPPSPRLLNPNVPKDLETICLKCLQKERIRRYVNCQELADELGRYLRGEPIHARPISGVARFWRLCKRYPVTASAIAMAVLALIAATGISTGFYIQASRALVKSDESLREAIAAVNEFFTTVSEDTLLNEPGMQPLREKLITKTKSYFERFSEQRAGDPKVEAELAGAYYRLGEIAAMLQSPDDAIKPYQKAREIQERMVAKKPKDLAALKALGDTVNAIGKVRNGQQDFVAAKSDFATAIKIRQQLTSADPQKPEYQRVLANTHMNLGSIAQFGGDLVGARKEFEEAQRIRIATLKSIAADDPTAPKLRRDLGMTLFNLGNLDWIEGAGAAEEHFKSSAATFEELAAADPGNLEFQKQLTLACRRVGNELANQGKLDEARNYFQRALERAEPLAQQNPKVFEYALEWAGVLMDLSDLESKAGNTADAASSLEKARDILTPLVKKFPSVARCQGDLATTLRELAVLQFEQGDKSLAKQCLDEALAISRELVKQYNQEMFLLLESTILRKFASVESSEGEVKAALEYLNEAHKVMRSLAVRFPGDQNQFDLALTLREIAAVENANGMTAAGAKHIQEAIQILEALVNQFPENIDFAAELKTTQSIPEGKTEGSK